MSTIQRELDAHRACSVCNGNDANRPCLYPGENRPGCWHVGGEPLSAEVDDRKLDRWAAYIADPVTDYPNAVKAVAKSYAALRQRLAEAETWGQGWESACEKAVASRDAAERRLAEAGAVDGARQSQWYAMKERAEAAERKLALLEAVHRGEKQIGIDGELEAAERKLAGAVEALREQSRPFMFLAQASADWRYVSAYRELTAEFQRRQDIARTALAAAGAASGEGRGE